MSFFPLFFPRYLNLTHVKVDERCSTEHGKGQDYQSREVRDAEFDNASPLGAVRKGFCKLVETELGINQERG